MTTSEVELYPLFDVPAVAEVPVEVGEDEPIEACRCGGIGAWWDALGRRHCETCDADGLRRSVLLANKAADLRGAA
jgi:hypothetical protein